MVGDPTTEKMKNLADCRFANGLTCETYREKILKMSTFKIIPTKFYPEDLRISGILKTKPQILRFCFEDLGYSDVTSTFEDLRIRGFFRCRNIQNTKSSKHGFSENPRPFWTQDLVFFWIPRFEILDLFKTRNLKTSKLKITKKWLVRFHRFEEFWKRK